MSEKATFRCPRCGREYRLRPDASGAVCGACLVGGVDLVELEPASGGAGAPRRLFPPARDDDEPVPF